MSPGTEVQSTVQSWAVTAQKQWFASGQGSGYGSGKKGCLELRLPSAYWYEILFLNAGTFARFKTFGLTFECQPQAESFGRLQLKWLSDIREGQWRKLCYFSSSRKFCSHLEDQMNHPHTEFSYSLTSLFSFLSSGIPQLCRNFLNLLLYWNSRDTSKKTEGKWALGFLIWFLNY